MDVKEALKIIQHAQSVGVTSARMDDVRKALEILVDDTSKAYTRLSEKYSVLRGTQPSKWDMELIKLMMSEVRCRVKARILSPVNGKWKLLEIGPGQGRDLQFFATQPDIAPVGIEISEGFLQILGDLERAGSIPSKSVLKLDMRHLVGIPDESIACIRNHATLHHLPLLWRGLGADEAVAESHRVLQPGGIFYVLVKRGNELKFIDTNEGLGSRLFQLFTPDTLSLLLERNGFRIIRFKKHKETGRNIEWLLALAERPE